MSVGPQRQSSNLRILIEAMAQVSPPRITWIGQRTVRFWYKDKKLRRGVYVQCSLEEFIARWSQHIPERYQHAVRNFGLFAPRALTRTSAAIFAILGQERRPRPNPRPWADSLKRDFGHDPLRDKTGERMKWVRRMAPTEPFASHDLSKHSLECLGDGELSSFEQSQTLLNVIIIPDSLLPEHSDKP